jgi:membrane protease YdiL (CAAX protease family)
MVSRRNVPAKAGFVIAWTPPRHFCTMKLHGCRIRRGPGGKKTFISVGYAGNASAARRKGWLTMAFDSTAFETYRRSGGRRTGLGWLVLGAIIVVLCWLAVTMAAIFSGFYLSESYDLGFGSMGSFMNTRFGVLVSLVTFSGIWVGVWVVMRFLHGERLRALFGATRRISWSDFAKGLVAVLITSVLSEAAIYAFSPTIQRTAIDVETWLLFLAPVLFLAFVQTSAEELLFRGYLLRGLAHRYRNPLVWGVVPALIFTSLHWNIGASPTMNACVLASIGSFAALVTVLVYLTGNLGAGMGAHFANNVAGFLLISHESALSSFALYRGAPLESIIWTPASALLIALIGLACCALTLLLLIHPRSPLRVGAGSMPHGAEPNGAAAI